MARDRTLSRVTLKLACVDCNSRNYQTTRRHDAPLVERKKFCKACGHHTLHRETK
jgi:large subunit ribosomal protein L33